MYPTNYIYDHSKIWDHLSSISNFYLHLLEKSLSIELTREKVFKILFHYECFIQGWVSCVSYEALRGSNICFQLWIKEHGQRHPLFYGIDNCPMLNTVVYTIAQYLHIIPIKPLLLFLNQKTSTFNASIFRMNTIL